MTNKKPSSLKKSKDDLKGNEPKKKPKQVTKKILPQIKDQEAFTAKVEPRSDGIEVTPKKETTKPISVVIKKIAKSALKNSVKNNSKELDLKAIEQVEFPDWQYYKVQTKKNQVVLHHTASGRGVSGDINWWKSNPQHIATCVLIDFKGIIHQLYSSKYWAHHLGIKSSFMKERGFDDYYQRNTILNKATIGIEIDSWGGLTKSDSGYWFTYTGDVVPEERVIEYPDGYRGYYAYERYTDEQIESVRQLLQYWNDYYDIPVTYNDDMWNVSDNAIAGESGVWTHNSYRHDKSDCHPQPEMVKMLKGLCG